tara:strand:- start:99 stop:245 length:147 start_codon:yes stop_codon:yes gene_type:complete
MDNKEKDISSVDFDKGKTIDDYKLLFQKLKSIKESINLLEKNFMHQEM